MFVVRIRLLCLNNIDMNFLKFIYNLIVIVLPITIIVLSVNKICCNALNNEISYSFRYAVDAAKVGVIAQHWEERRGDITHGSYSFLQPNGKIRIVDYQVNGPNGFRAAVRYRNPPGDAVMGHLNYPKNYRRPVALAEPVNYISSDLFKGRRTYPNLPSNRLIMVNENRSK